MVRSSLLCAILLAGLMGRMGAEETTSLFEHALAQLGAQPADLAIRTDRWDTRFLNSGTEALLKSPIQIPTFSENWMDNFSAESRSSEFVRRASQFLDFPIRESVTASPPVRTLPGIPPALGSSIRECLRGIARARPLLDRSVHSLSAEERVQALTNWGAVMKNSENSANLDAAVRVAEKFDQAPLLQAAYELTRSIDQALPTLETFEWPHSARNRLRWSTPSGDVLLSGGSDQLFSKQDLENVVLLINFSQRSRYQGPVAGAREDEIRVVIDLAPDVTLESDESGPSAGAGAFGIGLLYLPHAGGSKIVKAQDLSLGAGLFGVGGLFLNGPQAVLEGWSGTEGAASFGLGILVNQNGDEARYSARFGGQGTGFTRGVGFFIHRGSGAVIEGGLYYPDSRESLAMSSICQGVGYGPRAYAAGGIGMASVQGNGNQVISSYFAQGSGYWHGMGAFFVSGNENRLQARRYSQGAGVHTAVGTMILRGDRNQMINWAVGPGYGWDYGIGSFLAEGNRNSFRADWGTGHGDLNGHAMALIRGDNNRIALPDFGSGHLSRNAPSYGLALTVGTSNQILFSASGQLQSGVLDVTRDPWGLWEIQGNAVIKSTSTLPTPIWPKVDPSKAKNEGRPAPVGDVVQLVAQVSADRFDEFIQLRYRVAAFGSRATAALKEEYARAAGTRKMLLLSLLGGGRPDEGIDVVRTALRNPDWHLRRSAALVLGSWFDQERGRTSGRIPLLQTAQDILKKPSKTSTLRRFSRSFGGRFGEKYLPDLFSVLALNPDLSDEHRAQLERKVPDFVSPVPTEALFTFTQILMKDRNVYEKAIHQELMDAQRMKETARESLIPLLSDDDPEVLQAAIVSLGQIGDPEDVPRVRAFLTDPSAMIRQAAAVALVKAGPAGEPAIQWAVENSSAGIRSLAAMAASQSWNPGLIKKIILPALHDKDRDVRAMALANLSALESDPHRYRRKLRRELRRLERKDRDSSIRLLAGNALTRFR